MKVKSRIYLLLNFITNYIYAAVSSGPYIGLEIGEANQTINYNSAAFNIDTSGNSLNDNNWSLLGRVNLGYNISKYNGFEIGYNYSGLHTYSFPDTTASFNGSISAANLSYIFYIPTVVQNLSVFGRLGGGYDWINSNSSSNIVSSPNGASFTDVLGAGIKYNVSPKVSLRLEWLENGLLFPVSLNSGTMNSASYNSQTFMFGFNYHF